MIVMAVVLLVAVIGIAVYTRGSGDVTALAQGLAAADANVTTTAAGEHRDITLADGSKATLGPDSRFRIPADFGESMRGLEVTGTAHFVVAPAEKPRFMVRAGPALVTATGTAFTVRAYPDEDRVTVLAREGNITVTAGDSTHTLSQGAALVVANDSSIRAASAAELDEVGWASGMVVINDRPLRAVLPELKRWFGLDFFAADTLLLSRPVTLRARIDSLNEAIASIEQSGGLQMVRTGQNMAFREAKK
jgi:transmembrane sensor